MHAVQAVAADVLYAATHSGRRHQWQVASSTLLLVLLLVLLLLVHDALVASALYGWVPFSGIDASQQSALGVRFGQSWSVP
jgi:uncharacterized integral membrane protein